MKEFKGTKGKWNIKGEFSLNSYSPHYLTSDKGTVLLTFSTLLDGKENETKISEAKANALLISKAPEMLEMLKECKRVLDNVQSPATPAMVLSQEIDILIKQATEI